MGGFRAAYKGFADSVRLLLFLDAHRSCQDKEGKFFYILSCQLLEVYEKSRPLAMGT